MALPRPEGLDVKRPTKLAALGAALAASFAATAMPAQAAVSSASIDQLTATLNLDGADDNVTVSVSGGVLVHGQTTGGLNSARDWDSGTPGDQTVPADGTRTLIINGGEGNDAITIVARNTELASAGINGDGGDDVLTGSDANETLGGGVGDDRLVAGKGDDIMNGGAGNDALVWNQGDGTDRASGEAGNDVAEVNGAPTLGDVFTLENNGDGSIKLRRTNLGQFTFDAATERFAVNGLGGNDSVTANDGVGAGTLLSVDGGTGVDTVRGSEGADLILGGDANDVLTGGGGDDRIVGDRGTDTMNGGTGDDTLVWNNGDGTDVANGDEGRDDVEVNGATAAGDAFTVQPNGARVKFERTNLVPFTVDIGSSETLHANGLGGNDTITVGNVGVYEVTEAGGSGDDTLTGGDSPETFLGGSGNDTINPGGALDIVSGDEGDDVVDVRDRTVDVARGGDGNDSAIADNKSLDILDGFEAEDRTPNDEPNPADAPGPGNGPPAVVPPPVDTSTRPVTIRGGTVKVSRTRRTASIKVSCPAASSGNCTGSLDVLTASGVKFAGLKAVLRLGSARYDVRPGTTKTVRVKLVKGVERIADRKGNLKVRAVASTGDSGKTASSLQRLTLAFGAAKSGR
jgi:Ca2+-binding RTX toxin-like protein